MKTLLATLGLLGCVTAGAAAQEPAVVSGRVRDAATGSPIAGARVELGVSTVGTDPDGRFRIGGLATGSWRLKVAAIACASLVSNRAEP